LAAVFYVSHKLINSENHTIKKAESTGVKLIDHDDLVDSILNSNISSDVH
jgi:hypothetical protein